MRNRGNWVRRALRFMPPVMNQESGTCWRAA
jgi:hypothetical protein